MTFVELGQQVIQLQGQAIVTGTVLAGVTWLLCATVLKKARPALHAALWTVVVIRFLIPPVLPGEISLSGLLQRLQPLTQTAGLTELAMVVAETAAAKTVPGLGSIFSTGRSESASWAAKLGLGWLGWLYGFLLLVVGSRYCWRSFRSWGQVRSLPLAKPEVAKEVRQLATEIGLRHPPTVRTVGRTVSPCVMGLWRTTLVMPFKFPEELPGVVRQALILHELAHIRRGDLLVRGLQNLARVLFFFWPPVWWVCKRIECFTEMACDQWALSGSRIAPQLYARSLLEMVKGIAARPGPSRELAFAHQGRILEERFKMILRNKKVAPTLSWLMVPALAIWVSFALAGGSQAEIQESQRVEEKRVEIVTLVAKEEGELPARLLEKFPQADLDGDGLLAPSELKQYLQNDPELGKDGIFSWSSEHEGDTGQLEFRVIKLEGGEVATRLLEKFPEADLDGDGLLAPSEFGQYLPNDTGLGKAGVFTWSSEHESDTGQLESRVVKLVEADPHDGGDHGEDVEARYLSRSVVRALGKILERPQEADPDGDGELTKEERKEFFQGRDNDESLDGATIGIRIDPADDDGEDRHPFFVEYEAEGVGKLSGGGNGPIELGHQAVEKHHRLVWKTADGDTIELTVAAPDEQLDLNGDGEVDEAEIRASIKDRVQIKTPSGKIFLGAEPTEISEAEAIAKGEALARHRRQQLLQKYPQADLDGNGEIDADEAKALAAKLQTAKVRVESGKKPNQ